MGEFFIFFVVFNSTLVYSVFYNQSNNLDLYITETKKLISKLNAENHPVPPIELFRNLRKNLNTKPDSDPVPTECGSHTTTSSSDVRFMDKMNKTLPPSINVHFKDNPENTPFPSSNPTINFV